MKRIAILGSTGSIGRQTLQVIEQYPQLFTVSSLVAYSNIDLLLQQVKKFNPSYVGVIDNNADINLIKQAEKGINVLINSIKNADLVVVSTKGITSLKAVVYAIKNNINIALANKEVLVCGGELITNLLKKSTSKIYPIDSEHSAIWQCLLGGGQIDKLILTASGGPFLNYTTKQLSNVTLQQALAHPKWNMGAKISIDSATLANKALELIEARWLFDVPHNKMEIVTHPQSIIHSMVQFQDNAILAQLSNPDMKIPIQLALTYPDRLTVQVPPLSISQLNNMQFIKTVDTFGFIKLARLCLDKGLLYPAVFNSANEAAVQLFINEKINFCDISKLVHSVMESYVISVNTLNIDNIIYVDNEVKEAVNGRYK